jgi:hypothetical protein
MFDSNAPQPMGNFPQASLHAGAAYAESVEDVSASVAGRLFFNEWRRKIFTTTSYSPQCVFSYVSLYALFHFAIILVGKGNMMRLLGCLQILSISDRFDGGTMGLYSDE